MPASPYRIIDITDPGKDLDDEHKFVLCAGLARAGFIDISAVIACLEPARARARLAKGTFKELGFSHVPVGVGSDCFVGGDTSHHETDVSYLAHENEVAHDGYKLLVDTLLAAPDRSLILILNAGLTDAARLVREEKELFVRKIANVTIMGGVKSVNATTPFIAHGFLVPDDAANNAFDMLAAEFLYRELQVLGVPMTVVMRSACYAAQFPIRLYDQFAATGSLVGQALKDRQRKSIQQLWQAALSAAGSSVRGALPLSRDRAWFIQVFCGGVDPGVGYDDEIWPFVGTYNQYDSLAVIAAVPELRDHFFDPLTVEINGTTHRVIGLSSEMTAVKNKEDLIDFVAQMELAALKGTARQT